MKTGMILMCAALMLVPAAVWSEEVSGEGAGTLTAVEGDVQIGEGGQWRPASAGETVTEGQTIRTGAASSANVRFGEDVATSVAADTEIAVTDLLLRARLERMRSRVSAPTDTQREEMQVTPTTGVRGTEQTEEKAEDLKRKHYWNEGEKNTD